MPIAPAISEFNDAVAAGQPGAVASFIEGFNSARARGDRSSFSAGLTHGALRVLRRFAYDASILAVRTNCLPLIEQGLTVLAILADVDDARDLTFYLATLYHSATKLGVDTSALFNHIAALAPPGFLRDWMAGFPSRSAEHRNLGAFGLREIETEEGFAFESLPDPNPGRQVGRANPGTLLFRRLRRSIKVN